MGTKTGSRWWRASSLAALLCGALLCLTFAAPAVAAPTWLAPTDLSAPGENAEDPEVGVDANGDATAVWSRYNGTNDVIQAATRPAGGAWGAPVDLSAGEDAAEPQIAVNPSDEAVAVWQRDGVIQVARREAGGSWGAPVDLSATGQDSYRPQVALDQRGDAVVIWYRFNGGELVVEAASRPAGGTWGPAADLAAPGESALEPHVGIDADGEATAVWERYDGAAHWVIQAASKPAGGTWGTPVDISAPGQDDGEPELAVNPSGDAVAVWLLVEGGNEIVQAAGKPAGGAWEAPVDLSAPSANFYEPQVALDSGGGAVVAWGRGGGANVDVVQAVSRSATATPWEGPVDLSAPGGKAEYQKVSVDPSGDAVVVWQNQIEGSNWLAQAAARPAKGAWGAATDLSAPPPLSFTTVGAFLPTVAVDPEGDAVALWYRYDGAEEIVQAAAYDAAGPRLRSLAIPSSGTVGEPLTFSVSPFDVWSALGPVEWSFGDGANASGASASHAFAFPGTYAVAVSATDAAGNRSTATGKVTIAAAPSQPMERARASRVVEVEGRRAFLKLRCPAGGPCAGVAQLRLPSRKPRGRKRAGAGWRPVGRGAFQIAPGGTRTVRVKISARARARVRAGGRRGLKAKLGGTGIVGRQLLLRAKRKSG